MTLSVEEVLNYLNNYFIESYTSNIYVDFTAETKEIALATEGKTFADVGIELETDQYIKIEGSKLNDGIYKVDTVDTDCIVVEEALIDEKAGSIDIYGLAIPRKLLAIITEMQSWSGTANVKSESLGPHSITYDRPVTVFNQFESRIKHWRKVGW